MSDAFDDHNFIDVAPPAEGAEGPPPRPCDCHLCTVVTPLLTTIEAVLTAVTPKPPKPKAKGDPDVLAALNALAARTGVPVKPADKVELQRATALHGKDAMLASLNALTARDDVLALMLRANPAFVNRNLIGTAAAQCARRATKKAPVVWRPDA